MRAIILLCLLGFWQGAAADATVWKIARGDNELYIGGTLHVLSKNDYPLPEEFEKAYRSADSLVLETDLIAMQQPETTRRMLDKVSYRDGRSLRDDLSPATFEKLADYLASHPFLKIDELSKFKPGMASMMLTIAELQRLGMGDTGVDAFFAERAVRDGKPVGELETAEQQIDMLAEMGTGYEDELMLGTLDELTNLPALMNDIKHAWRTGDMRELEKLGIEPMRSDFPILYRSLLVARNQQWLPKIEALLATPEKELVLVGALHLAADEGVIEQLRRRGYRVEPLQ